MKTTTTPSTLRMLPGTEVKHGICDVCYQNSTLRFRDAATGVQFGDCCRGFVIMLSSVGIRPPTPLEWVSLRQQGQ